VREGYGFRFFNDFVEDWVGLLFNLIRLY